MTTRANHWANDPNLFVYISGKITGLQDLNVPKFEAAEQTLRFNYFNNPRNLVIINPHKLPDNHDKTWASYMRECIKAIAGCEEVFVLDDWQDSKGALVEVIIAKILGLKLHCLKNCGPLKVSYWWLFYKLLRKL